ncbi:hypothetical protein RMN57_22990 [Kitasatospora sp. CM 4170]|uniref:Uncharacterized protein n=1 Tax=Kitasatospora aburaviensis TaxID=67265 RepID=A0ABW1F0D9_9ACTN|nr:hypothetical protein [Kitasatospora sp. CM 4170]WNM47359.1 hypothetical protein RMN57_22990 [Kitasatospora sp. CM 4170]
MLQPSGIGSSPVRLPTLLQLRAYMKHSGWLSQPPGAGGAIWIKGDAKIGIPTLSRNDPVIAKGVLERLAAHERTSAAALAPKIRYHRMDVTLLRAANDHRITDTIPFEAAATVIGSARKLLRAAGTTAWHERGDIGGNYSRRGDEVLKKARMDHTQEGSFIIPVLVPLPEPPEVAGEQMTLPDMELYTAAPEPFERRVTRTFAQSIMAVKEIIVDPERSPSVSDLHTVVERGVSREFCAALAQILAEPAVGEFETTFDWAESLPGPATMPGSISIEHEAHLKIENAAALLKRSRIDAGSTFSGSIIELRRRTDDPYGFVTVSTVRRGRVSEIRVRLPFSHYQAAVSWHRAQRAVIVEGEVAVGVGRRLVVDHPVKCRPIDELQLALP